MKKAASAMVDIYRFRGFILGSVRRDFEQRYVNSLFGALWAIILPLSSILIYVIVFSKLMNARLPDTVGHFSYSVYLCAGMISWGLFAELMGRFPGVFVSNGNLIKKMSFPRICLPITALVSSLMNFTVTFAVLIVVLLVLGVRPSMVWFSLIPLVGILLIFALGLGVLLAVLNVFFRDVGPMFAIVTQFWFWATPIVYPVSILPDWLAEWMVWNPMAIIVQGFQNVILYGSHPSYMSLAGVFILAVVLCYLAMKLYTRRAGEMVDEL